MSIIHENEPDYTLVSYAIEHRKSLNRDEVLKKYGYDLSIIQHIAAEFMETDHFDPFYESVLLYAYEDFYNVDADESYSAREDMHRFDLYRRCVNKKIPVEFYKRMRN